MQEVKKLIIILGSQASGKMTVGEELSKALGLKLFHNHMAVEIANHFYGFSGDVPENIKEKQNLLFGELRESLKKTTLTNIGKSYHRGLVMTCVVNFDNKNHIQDVFDYVECFALSAESIGEKVQVHFVELVCDFAERLKRNVSPNRLEKKPSKRNIEWSRQNLETDHHTKRQVSNDCDIEMIKKKTGANHYLKIDNTNLTAEQVAKIIAAKFNL